MLFYFLLLQSSSTSGSSIGGGPASSGFKVNILESVDRIKEEFNFMQSQYHKYERLPRPLCEILIFL